VRDLSQTEPLPIRGQRELMERIEGGCRVKPRVRGLSLQRDPETDLRNPRGAVRRERYPVVRILWRHEQREQREERENQC
jgi:hypothetical protein